MKPRRRPQSAGQHLRVVVVLSLSLWLACSSSEKNEIPIPADARTGSGEDDVSLGCRVASDCTELPEDTECQMRVCTDNICSLVFIEANTPLLEQMLGDCEDIVCDGAGATTALVRNSDIPVDGNDCTDDLCSEGVPVNPTSESGTTCGTDLSCDGLGACVGCTLGSECGTDTFCQSYSCSQGVCAISNTANDTAVPSGQTDGDCQSLVCDGNGLVVSVGDNVDVPDEDPNQCTSPACALGLPSLDYASAGSACTFDFQSVTPGLQCDGAGTCFTCASRADCNYLDVDCQTRGECQAGDSDNAGLCRAVAIVEGSTCEGMDEGLSLCIEGVCTEF